MILAIDPGLGTCGWAIVDPSARVLDLGVILTERDKVLEEATDRARRADHQAEVLAEAAQRYNVAEIALEAMSFGGPPSARFHMAISVGLSWGVATGIARTLGLNLYAVPPKRWQRAVVPNAGKRLNYALVEAALEHYVGKQAFVALSCIAKGDRNHALDACGVGLFAALRPNEVEVVRRRKVAA